MLRKILLGSVSLALMLSASWAHAETAKDVYLALMRLASQCEVGVPRADFARYLGEAKFQYNLYLKQLDGNKNPEYVALVDKILRIYADADTCASGGRRAVDDDPKNMGPIFKHFWEPLLVSYPQLAKSTTDGGATDTRKEGKKIVRVFHPDYATSILIALAGKEVKSLPIPK